MGRSNKNITKKKIYEAFCIFVEHDRFRRVTVSALIEEAGVTRKTFYNHFSTQDELVAWGFRKDLFETLASRFPSDMLLLPNDDPYNFEDLPCYVRIPSGALSLDQSSFFSAMQDAMKLRSAYYSSLMHSDMATELLCYLTSLFTSLFLEDIEVFLQGRKMLQQEKRLIASLFAEGFVHLVADSISSQSFLLEDAKLTSTTKNMIHESMRFLIESYQSEKSMAYFGGRRLP